jgi:hypothetical protein
MMSRAFRPVAAILSILLLSGVPTHAAPVAISEVIQVLGSYQNPPELRLRSVSQNTNYLVSDGDGPSPVASAAQESAAGDVVEIADASTIDASSGDTLLLFLAAIPFFFIHGCDDCETPTPPSTPPSTPEIPEPASLLLFGSGLAAFGAGLRRRYARGKLAAQIQTTEEG